MNEAQVLPVLYQVLRDVRCITSAGQQYRELPRIQAVLVSSMPWVMTGSTQSWRTLPLSFNPPLPLFEVSLCSTQVIVSKQTIALSWRGFISITHYLHNKVLSLFVFPTNSFKMSLPTFKYVKYPNTFKLVCSQIRYVFKLNYAYSHLKYRWK